MPSTTLTLPPLIAAQRAARARDEAAEQYRAAVLAAHEAGFSIRQIAQAVGTTHPSVLLLIRRAQAASE
jgi:DNA-directed RNA polymerase specialized sigma24 family protein